MTKILDAERMSLPPDMARPLFTGAGSYMQSIDAEEVYRDLIRWMRTVNNEDAVFDMKIDFKDDAAEIIYMQDNQDFGSGSLVYLSMDVLLNHMHRHLNEEVLLEDF